MLCSQGDPGKSGFPGTPGLRVSDRLPCYVITVLFGSYLLHKCFRSTGSPVNMSFPLLSGFAWAQWTVRRKGETDSIKRSHKRGSGSMGT